MEASSTSSRRLNLARALLFAASLALFGLIGFSAGEWLLSSNRDRIRLSDKLDPDLVHYDPELGWALTPGWQGSHSHNDFQARYSVDSHGFRADSDWAVKRGCKRIAVFGDSFVFGLGVNNDQTFVHLLDKAAGSKAAFVNCAVPGFSNDQEMLYMERILPTLRPDVVLLVVYLGNDLFDNQLAYPLQVRGSKPFFTLGQNRTLELHNSPAPAVPSRDTHLTLSSMVFGPTNRSIWRNLSAESEVLSLLNDSALLRRDRLPEFSQRFGPAVDLFWAIIARARASAEKSGAKLEIVILGGRSFIEAPNSISGQYQEALRRGILQNAPEKAEILDLAALMQAAFKEQRTSWFFKNDGHLNPVGHQAVASMVESGLGLQKF